MITPNTPPVNEVKFNTPGGKHEMTPTAPATARLRSTTSRGMLRVLLAMLLAVASAAALVSCSDRDENASVPAVPQAPDLAEVKPKAEAGDGASQNRLGEIYAEGKQVRQDYSEAIKWYRQAAEKGITKADYNLGVLHEIGQGVDRDEAEAARWYHKAAALGLVDAEYNLAAMYGLGRGVSRDPKEALKWYERAAEQGDALSCYNLAERYERGKDVSQDFVEAYKWHALAASLGLKDGAAAKSNLERKLTAAQLADGRRRAEDFKAKHPVEAKR